MDAYTSISSTDHLVGVLARKIGAYEEKAKRLMTVSSYANGAAAYFATGRWCGFE